MQVLIAIGLYGMVIWPLMFVYGLTWGIKGKINNDDKYHIYLIVSVVGLIMMVMPLYAMGFLE